ncbi:uncharacterized protein LOC143431795 [Xylocopa sonorina]|uniref:uncharacterized protein LOC143431795 n=1 Tax=Xylocopa sonorina TaxID=1818115 RepID=UPI00403B00E2
MELVENSVADEAKVNVLWQEFVEKLKVGVPESEGKKNEKENNENKEKKTRRRMIVVKCHTYQIRLKPHQKMNLIRTYLLARYIHKLVANQPPLYVLDQTVHGVKQVIKETYHFHSSTADRIISTSKSQGDLSVQKVANIVKFTKLRNALQMSCSDEAVRSAASIAAAIRRHRRGEEGPSKRILEFIGNKWLYNPDLLRPSGQLNAIKLKTHTFCTGISMRRADNERDYLCKRCGIRAKTLSHIGDICKMVANKVSSRCAVFEEPEVNVVGDHRRPDLVIKDLDKILVVDVTVRYDPSGRP